MLDNSEIWKDCKGYEGLYQVSSLGRVWSVRSQKVLRVFNRGNGYYAVNLFAKNGKRKLESVHRLVALAFLDNPNHYPEVNHKDQDKSNNKVENLEWCSSKYNVNYGDRNERAGRAKGKTVAQYTQAGKFVGEYYSTYEAERRTGINRANIGSVCRGERQTAGDYVWRYV